MHTLTRLLSALLLVGLAGSASPASAQAPSEVEALKAEITRLRDALQRVESRVAVLEQGAPAGAVSAPAAGAAPASPPAGAATAVPSGQPLSRVARYVRQRETMAGEVLAAARVDNVPDDPDMRGFVQFPGTDTVMRLGGYAKVDAIYDGKPAGDPDLFLTSSIPTGPTLGLNSFNLHVRQTRINLDLRRPVARDDLRIFVESDFFGLTPNLFRMRHAYGQWRNLLVGQSFSTFMDTDALVDTLDFEGPPNTVFVLQPQVRYTVPVTGSQSVAFAIEKPTTEVRSQSIVTPRTPAPDGIVRWRYDHGRGHLQVAQLFRAVAGYVGTEASETLFGWGTNLSGSVFFGDRNNIVVEGVYGHGLGRYLNDTAGLALEAGIEGQRVRTLPLYGVNGAYQHYWTARLRSSLTYGFLTLNNVPTQAPDTFHRSQYAGGNVIFAPTAAFSFGAEVLYGTHEVKSGETGNATRLQVSLQYDLVRR